MPSDHPSGSVKRLVLTDLSIGFIVLVFFAAFKDIADYVLLTAWIFTFCYLVRARRFMATLHQILAALLSAIWIHFAKDYYGYEYNFLKIFGLNSLPLLAWSLTLFGLHEYCSHFQFKKWVHNFLFYVLVFWFFGILVETVTYHNLGLHNSLTSAYEGLPICDCVHAPGWMQLVYLMMGPFYYLLTVLADLAIEKLQMIEFLVGSR